MQATANTILMDISCQDTLSIGHFYTCLEDMMIVVYKITTLNLSIWSNCFNCILVYVTRIVNNDNL